MIKYFAVTVSALAISTAANAQDTAASTQAPATAAPETPDSAGIADIVVTASRREESAQRAALSIQAITSDDLLRANISKPEDLSSIATGVQIGTAGPFPQAYIRGVGNYSTQVFAESAVAFNLDGVYVSRTWATRGAFYDLDRVEVLKGPQGTLYGRNASGGAINVISAKPKLDGFGGFAELNVGNYDLVQGTGAINIPISANAAIRASGQLTRRDGFLTDGYDNDKTEAARLQFLWEPTNDVSLLISGNYQHVGGKGAGPVLKPQLPGNKFRGATDPRVADIIRAEPGIGPLLIVPQDDGFVDASVYAVSAELNWNLGIGTLTVLPAYRFAKLEMRHYLPGFSVQNAENDKQTSVEVRLSNQTDRLKWVLGGFFFDERQANLPDQSVLRVRQGINFQNSTDLDLATRSYAAFGQATFSVSDRFRLTGGLRYTYERKKVDEVLINYGLPSQAPPPLCLAGTFDPTSPAPPLFCRVDLNNVNKDTFKAVTFKAGFEFDVADRSLAYGTISTGFKSGGFFTAPPPNTFAPEKLTAFELGLKNRFLDNRLQLNIEAFYWKYKDHQESYTGPTSLPGFFTFITANAGKAKSYGADLDVLFRATQSDEVGFKVQYNKSNYDTFEFDYLSGVFGPPTTGCAVGPLNGLVQTIDCSGKSLVRAPLWTGTANYNHTFDLGSSGSIVASADVQFSSKADLTVDFLDAGRQKAYAIASFDLTYKTADDRVTVSGYVDNIWNSAVYNQAFRNPFISQRNPLADPDGVFLGTLKPPRTYGARVRVNF